MSHKENFSPDLPVPGSVPIIWPGCARARLFQSCPPPQHLDESKQPRIDSYYPSPPLHTTAIGPDTEEASDGQTKSEARHTRPRRTAKGRECLELELGLLLSSSDYHCARIYPKQGPSICGVI